MLNRKVIELLLQLKSAKAHGKSYKKSNHTCSAIFCVTVCLALGYNGGVFKDNNKSDNINNSSIMNALKMRFASYM